MKKSNLLLIGLGLFTILGANAQVSIEDVNTVKLGVTSNTICSSNTGKYGQASGVIMGVNSSDRGTIIEAGNTESAGIYLDGDKIVMWAPGDANLINFCDEDLMVTGNNYQQAIVAYIDEDGYYYQVSDSTKKEQIVTIHSSLSKLMKIRGVEYYHKKNNETTAKENKIADKTMLNNVKRSGFLAQEVEEIIPEAVATNKSGVKFVNYQAMIPFLVEALKEQQTQVLNMQTSIQQLKDEIALIKQNNKSIKQAN